MFESQPNQRLAAQPPLTLAISVPLQWVDLADVTCHHYCPESCGSKLLNDDCLWGLLHGVMENQPCDLKKKWKT